MNMILFTIISLFLIGCGSSSTSQSQDDGISKAPEDLLEEPGNSVEPHRLEITQPTTVIEGAPLILEANLVSPSRSNASKSVILSVVDWQLTEAQQQPTQVLTRLNRWRAIAPVVNQDETLDFQVTAIDTLGTKYQTTFSVLVLDSDNPELNAPDVSIVIDGESQNEQYAAGQTLDLSAEFDEPDGSFKISWYQDDDGTAPLLFIGDRNAEALSVQLPIVDTETDVVVSVALTVAGNTSIKRKTLRISPQPDSPALPIIQLIDSFTMRAGSERVFDACLSTGSQSDALSFVWRDQDQPEIELSNECVLTYKAPQPRGQIKTLYLTAIDENGAAIRQSLTITVIPRATNELPVIASVKALPSPAYPGEQVRLIVDASDADGDPLKFEWKSNQADIEILDSNTRSATIIAPAFMEGADNSYGFTVRVFDELTELDQEAMNATAAVVEPEPSSDAPSLVECFMDPAQPGCIASGAARLTQPNFYQSCVDDPFGESCVLAALAASGVSLNECFSNPESCNIAEVLRKEPVANTIYSLGAQQSAGTCNTPAPLELEHLVGTLHEHTAYSDGAIRTSPRQVMAQVKDRGFDFTFVTDHSDSFALPVPLCDPDQIPEEREACVISDTEEPINSFSKWEATLDQANAASEAADFTAIRGFEWTSDRFGHINVLDSTNNLNAKAEPGYAVSMEVFWQWFLYPAELGGGSDGLISFNHPGREDDIHRVLQFLPYLDGNPDSDEDDDRGDYAYTYNNFRYVRGADYRTVGVEVFGKGSLYDPFGINGSWLGFALDKGWYLAPTGSEDHHDRRWGADDLPKTVLLARSNTPEDLRRALLARRTYATRQNFNDLTVNLDLVDQNNRYPMGTRLRTDNENLTINYSVERSVGELEDVSVELITSLKNDQYDDIKQGDIDRYDPIMVSKGSVGSFAITNVNDSMWYYLRVKAFGTENDHIIAITAPVWVEKSAEGLLPPCPELPSLASQSNGLF